jgi:hypothetical protein
MDDRAIRKGDRVATTNSGRPATVLGFVQKEDTMFAVVQADNGKRLTVTPDQVEKIQMRTDVDHGNNCSHGRQFYGRKNEETETAEGGGEDDAEATHGNDVASEDA